jgi:hypothetical protein
MSQRFIIFCSYAGLIILLDIQKGVADDAQTYDSIAIVHVIRIALNQVEVQTQQMPPPE